MFPNEVPFWQISLFIGKYATSVLKVIHSVSILPSEIEAPNDGNLADI